MVLKISFLRTKKNKLVLTSDSKPDPNSFKTFRFCFREKKIAKKRYKKETEKGSKALLQLRRGVATPRHKLPSRQEPTAFHRPAGTASCATDPNPTLARVAGSGIRICAQQGG